jgi:hypothetical protein
MKPAPAPKASPANFPTNFHKLKGENAGFELHTFWGTVKITPRNGQWNVYALVKGVANTATYPKLTTALLKALQLREVFNSTLANLAKNPHQIK